MKGKTRSMVMKVPGKMSLGEFDLPRIGLEDGLLKVEMAGVIVARESGASEII